VTIFSMGLALLGVYLERAIGRDADAQSAKFGVHAGFFGCSHISDQLWRGKATI